MKNYGVTPNRHYGIKCYTRFSIYEIITKTLLRILYDGMRSTTLGWLHELSHWVTPTSEAADVTMTNTLSSEQQQYLLSAAVTAAAVAASLQCRQEVVASYTVPERKDRRQRRSAQKTNGRARCNLRRSNRLLMKDGDYICCKCQIYLKNTGEVTLKFHSLHERRSRSW